MIRKASTSIAPMQYRRCGASGLELPAISLGFWHNFGRVDDARKCRQIALRAFELGVTHFDLANNYGPPPGAAEEYLGQLLRKDLRGARDRLVISTKAGYRMWDGPYGDGGSRKYLLASLDQSLKRLGLDYVDIYYHHRPDPATPLEETMGALDAAVRQGKALYAGISSYRADRTAEASQLLKQLGTRCLVHQPSYSMLDRWIEKDLLGTLEKEGIGCAVFCPLAQGLLTSKYLNGIPADSRAAKPHGFLQTADVKPEVVSRARKLNDVAKERGQTLAQLALAWVLRDARVTSAIVGASSVAQLEDNVAVLNRLDLSPSELSRIEEILR